MKQFANKTIYFKFFIVTLLFIVFFIVSCSKEKPSLDEIKIGVIGPFTGEGATYGESMTRGFELAFENKADIRLIYEDSKLNPKEGVNALRKLIASDKVKVVLGAAASGVSLAMAPSADSSEVILFSSISTSDDLSKGHDYFFRNVPRNEIQGITGARFLYQNLGKRTVVIFKKNDEYANNISGSFRREYEKLGGRILLEDFYEPGASDFRTSVAKIKSFNPEGIYIPGNYQEVALFLKQAYEGGLKAQFIGGDGSYSPELINIAGNAAENSYYTIMAVRHNEFYESFKNNFVAKYNKEPDVYDAYAFEAGFIVRTALDSVGNDANKVRDFLLTHTFESSLTGSLRFDSNGEVNRQYGIVQVKGGEFIDIEY